jgi:hypothetical protein
VALPHLAPRGSVISAAHPCCDFFDDPCCSARNSTNASHSEQITQGNAGASAVRKWCVEWGRRKLRP